MIPFAAADIHAPASNTAAVVTYAQQANRKHVICGFAFSYDVDPTGGLLTITDDGNTVFTMTITAKGAGPVIFPIPMCGTAGKALVVTLAEGGGGVTGKLSVLGHYVS